MQSPMRLKAFVLVLSLSAIVYLLPQQQNMTTASCTNAVAIAQNGIDSYSVQCTLAPQTSWLSWFSGQSSSAQFHFIDLLELLSRFHTKQV